MMKVLILKVNQLGDNVIYLPVVQTLIRELGPDSVELFTSRTAAELYDELLPASQIHRYDRDEFNASWKSPGMIFRLIRLVRKIRPGLVLVPYDQGNVARFLAYVSGARQRVGAVSPDLKTNWCLDHKVKTDFARPMAEQDWEVLLRACEVMEEWKFAPGISRTPPPPDLSHLVPEGVKPEPRRVLIHSGASRVYKEWPLENFIGLAARLSDEGFDVWWSDQGKEEENRLDPRVRRLPLGRLRGFVSELASCGLFIGNNSGPMNLANALSVPSVILSGPSPPKWDPYWHQEKVLNLRLEELSCQPCDLVTGPIGRCVNAEEPMACMKRWSEEAVLEQALQLWSRCYENGDKR